MDNHHSDLLRHSEEYTNEPLYSEKEPHTQTPKTSKQYLWRIFRLGASLALTITALALTLIILVDGRYGDGASNLALLSVDMSKFARFNPPTIQLVHNTTKTVKERQDFVAAIASNDRRGLIGSFTSDVASVGGSIETKASAVASAVETKASAIQTAVAGAAASAEAEAGAFVDKIGDDIKEIASAVETLMDKVLDKIQDELNEWLNETASALNDLDIPNKMSLHMTTHCSSASRNESNSTQTTCKQTFRSGETTFNSTANNGTIFGFQPGTVIAKVLGVFFVPPAAQQDIRHPVDVAANTMEKLIKEAESEVSAWTVNLMFIPIVAVYSLAAVFIILLLLVLIAATAVAVRGSDSVPPQVFSLCALIGAGATILLGLGSVVVTVVSLVAHIANLGGHVIGIEIASGSRLKWVSWGAFAIMAFVTLSFKVEEYVAEVVFWWHFLGKILRGGKSKQRR